MPRRDDIHSILIIGSGPIVIGQACEFDYSGTQACKALREEGYRVILVNSNPATIMTDPDFADATYVEPLTGEVVERSSNGAARRRAADARRADRAQPGDGAGRTGVLEQHGVELIGANAEAIGTAEDREKFKEAMTEIGLESPRRASRTRWTRPAGAWTRSGCPSIIRPAFILGGSGGGIAYNVEEFDAIGRAGSTPARSARS